VSYLDAVRPEPGWRTECAFLASYSADLVALVAALLALAGLDDDRGSGSKVDLANAVDALADRVRLVVQAGRLVAPTKTPKILAILDRYVREVILNESEASWHPKAALTKQVTDDGKAAKWRLWIGSRNLTRDLSWDIGLALIGQPGGRGGDVPGIPELGQTLARHANLPALSPGKVRSELREVRWEAPPGCSIPSLRLLGGDLPRTLPPEPPRVRKLVVVSPFLDGTVVGQFGRWGNAETQRTLVSTLPELARLANQTGKPLAGFRELLYLDAPLPDALFADDRADKENATSQDEEPEPRGLHAKLIYAESAGGRRIWTGSANATQRGWNGPNVEIIAELEVTPEVVTGLAEFVESATTVRHDELGETREPDEIEERLEQARKHVASSWGVTQRHDDRGPVLVNPTDPNPPDSGVTMSVGLLGGPQVLWQRGATLVPLPRVAAGELTELVCCRLGIGERSVSWLQRAPIDPPPGEERDRQALARYLDPRTFLLWIRSLLTGEPCGDGGGGWDDDPTPSVGRKTGKAGPTWWAPTIEEVLRSWTRDPSSLALIDKKVRQYLKLYEEQVDGEMTPEERAVVSEFHMTWQVLRRSLVSEEK
jgi:hypothetical protein